MLVFIDESGCPGMKVDGGSSDFFVVTMVIFEDHEEAGACEQKIQSLRRELGLPEDVEFHFNKSSNRFRSSFLEAVALHEFFYFAFVLNKRRLTAQGFQSPDSLYKYTFGMVFENAKPYLDEAIVIIDGSGDRCFQRQLQTYLKRRVNSQHRGTRFIRKVKIQDSKQNDLLQLADMICGAVARDFKTPHERGVFRRLVSHREMRVQLWPK